MVSLRCCGIQFRKWHHSVRVVLVFVFLLIFAYDAYWNVLSFSRQVNTAVTPWIYPHIFSDRYLMLCISLSVMALFCDAPFIDMHQPYTILRAGRTNWALGIIFYIIISSFIVSITIWFVGTILGVGTMSFSDDWGTVIRSLAGQYIIRERIVRQYSPIAASALALLLSTLVFSFIGLLFFILNLSTTPVLGTISVGFFCLLDFFNLFFLQDAAWLFFCSPISWANLDQLGVNNRPSVSFAIVMLLGIILILCILILRKSSQMDIKAAKDGWA